MYAGYWEFPGGKVEPGESAQNALARELREELGIEVQTAYPWLTRVFSYPHAIVRLHFFRVTQWTGDLYPHEKQSFSWQNPASFDQEIMPSLAVSPVLPANLPILHALKLPALYAISNASELGVEPFLIRLRLALENGLKLVQLREKEFSREALRSLGQRMLPILKEFGAQLIVNSDIELAQEIGADGVQLTRTQLNALTQRPNFAWCGASCHSAEELRLAEALGCDFALLSPVLPTRSHPGALTLGWNNFSASVANTTIPVYALGGLTRHDMEKAWQQGAHGVALLRQAWMDEHEQTADTT